MGVASENENFFKTDWDLFYDAGKLKFPKKDGVYSFTEYKRDIEKIKELGLTHFRFGIEWARIEPKMGHYNLDALKHYKEIAEELKKNNIVPIICLWHWTFPSWGYDINKPDEFGWMNKNIKNRWPAFVKLVAQEFKNTTLFFAPQNEPNAQSLAGFFLGIFPPGAKHSLSLYRKHIDDSADAFITAANIIKSNEPKSQIISIQNMIYWEKAWWDIMGYFYDLGEEFNYHHLDKIKDSIDILGFNYYYRIKASPFPNERIIDPNGLKDILLSLSSKYKKPLLITENGWPDASGEVKNDYFLKHIKIVKELRKETHLIGYFYWSLIDNFEWAEGYKEKYGLYKFIENTKSLEPYEVAKTYQKTILMDRK